MPTTADFEQLEQQLRSGGAAAALDHLADNLREQRRYHELFDARLMQVRRRLGLPVVLSPTMDELAEPLRTQVEDGYLEACREVGSLLLAEGKLREAWTYLRPVGDTSAMAEKLNQMPATDGNLDELIELSLQEGISPVRGFGLVLQHYGTCNAITMFDAELGRRGRQHQQQAAELLLRHLHAELLASVRTDIERQEGAPPKETTLLDLVNDRDWLFLNNNYHIDTTHLASVIRFARLVDEPEPVRLAKDLTDYGRHLSGQFHFDGEPPFTELYEHHHLFFAAQLGERVEEALRYFREQAEAVDARQEGTLPAEAYIGLLWRLGRREEALEAAGKLLPHGTRTTGLSLNLMELSRIAGNYDRLLDVCRESDDLIGYAAALVARNEARG